MTLLSVVRYCHSIAPNDTQIYVVFNIKFNKMEEDKNLEQNLDKSNEKLHISDVIVSCPKCNSSWIGDIGYDNCECWMCGNVFKLKSKTGLEDN
jgi:hypothetical protein